jgi:hypothetical protein
MVVGKLRPAHTFNSSHCRRAPGGWILVPMPVVLAEAGLCSVIVLKRNWV